MRDGRLRSSSRVCQSGKRLVRATASTSTSFPIFRIAWPTTCSFSSRSVSGPYLSEHVGRFDVAHLHACRNIPGAIAAYHLRRAGVPYLLAPNGTAPRIERRVLAKRVFDVLMGQGF